MLGKLQRWLQLASESEETGIRARAQEDCFQNLERKVGLVCFASPTETADISVPTSSLTCLVPALCARLSVVCAIRGARVLLFLGFFEGGWWLTITVDAYYKVGYVPQ